MSGTVIELSRLPAWKLPSTTKGRFLLQGALSERARSFTARSSAGDALFTLLPAAEPFGAACTLELSAGGELWKAAVSDTRFLALHPALQDASGGPEPDERDLPEEVRRALLEVTAIPLLYGLASVIGLPAAITNAVFHDSSPAGFAPIISYAVEFADASGAPVRLILGLDADDGACMHAAELAARIPAPDGGHSPALHECPLEIAFEAGYLSLAGAECRSLSAGDVVLPGQWLPDSGKVMLSFNIAPGRKASVECSLEEGSATVLAGLSTSSEDPMDLEAEMELTVTFELERRTVPFSQLQSLQPGSTFLLGTPGDAPVTLRAGGRALARGRLVDVNGTLGVQIIETI